MGWCALAKSLHSASPCVRTAVDDMRCRVLARFRPFYAHPKVYKFIGVNVSHVEFISRYHRLGPRHLTGPEVLQSTDSGVHARACEGLASTLLVADSHSRGADQRSKYEMGTTQIFIRWVLR